MVRLAEKGQSLSQIKTALTERGKDDAKWRHGRTAVFVFNAGEDVAQVQKEAYTHYMSENGLAPLAFPSLKKMEEEVVAMSLDLLHAPEGAAGAISSGGSESIFLAMKTLRDEARAQGRCRSGVKPKVILCFSAHPAFDKAAAILDMEMIRTPVGSDYCADPKAFADAIDENTIGLVGSAPCFPFGTIDPIEALSELAEAHGLWLHVDACVGGYLAPFVRMNGTNLPAFDFALSGVRSMSADLHKYGYAAKGASCVLFREAALRERMTFRVDDWPCGTMITPTLAGTRPGGAIAAAWAVMQYLGREGYCEKQREVTETRAKIQAGVEALGFQVLGAPQLGLMAYRRDDIDMALLWQALYDRGWCTALNAEPSSIHLMLSPYHKEVWQEYLADLEELRDAALRGDLDPENQPAARYN